MTKIINVIKKHQKKLRPLFFFAFSGACALVIDTLILWLLVSLGVHYIIARIPAILIAIMVTFLINRHTTFKHRPSPLPFHKAYIRYLLLSWLGVCVNAIAYIIAVTGFNIHYLLAVTLATLASMSLNFITYRQFVFSGSSQKSEERK